MDVVSNYLLFVCYLVFLTPLVLGTIRRTKARLQNRVGAPLYQVLFDLGKLIRKGETVSQTMTWVFRSAAAMNFAMMILLALIVPWASSKPQFGGVDLFFVVYTFAAMRFFRIIAALDSGSAFGAFGGSREATLAVLVEPASMLSFVALAIFSKSSNMNTIFSYVTVPAPSDSAIWLLSGVAILLSGLVELSRMPVDDATTHLELTMVHEAMLLESSGRNLALNEYTHALHITIIFGLVTQCFMHSFPMLFALNDAAIGALSIFGILLLACSLGIFEVLSVKLRWRKAPDFIAYSLTMSLLACLISIGKGLISQ